MKKVSRTIESHVIRPAKVVMVDGELRTEELFPITVVNEGVTSEKALRLTQRKYGKKDQYVILGIETSKTTYAIPLDQFLELAEIVDTVEE